ncbi:MAG TPA: hypothetical protein VN915_16205 [Elusimicrobiota bacterium]|nr:hypothetical protein [Elusimicrobiota bacterium]
MSACAGGGVTLRKKVDAKLAAGDYAGAQALVEGAKTGVYGYKNRVLYHLDLGAIEHDAGKYKASDDDFSVAEGDMDQLYTKSLHQAAGMLLLNDNTMDYAGERFERALVNVYRALNYLFMDDRENALVEIRKLSRLLQEYSDTSGGSIAYKDDAFGQYLSALLYADGGQPDDARIAFEAAGRAYDSYATAYGTPRPPLDSAPLGDMNGELVFIHANGTAPLKQSKTFQVAWGEGLAAVNSSGGEPNSAQARNAIRAGVVGHAITVAYPVYVQEPFRIRSSEIEVDGVKSGTRLVEDVSAIAQKALAQRQALIRTRAVARAAIKYILSQQVVIQAKRQYGEHSWQAFAAQAGTAALAAGTETADTRAWSTLPAQFLMTRMPLPPGEHQVTVRYRGAGNEVLLTRNFTVTIRKGQRAYLHDRTAL